MLAYCSARFNDLRYNEAPACKRHDHVDVLQSNIFQSWLELELALSWTPNVSEFAIDRRPLKAIVLELCSPMI